MAQLSDIAFDVFFAEDFMLHTYWTKLFQDVYWKDKNPDKEAQWPDAASLSFLHPEAVVFHRNKAGDLIDRLSERLCGTNGAPREPATGGSSVSPPSETRPAIFTYYEPVSGIDESDARKLIAIWEKAWTAVGYKPEVLGVADAAKHPRFMALYERFKSFPSINPAGYDLSCYLRWLAMSARGGGLMSDYDCLPLVDKPIPMPFNIQMFSGNKNDPNIPCLFAGTKEEFERVIAHMEDSTPSEKQWSDMIALRDFKCVNNGDVKEYGEDDWAGITRIAVHFSNHCMQPAGKVPRWQHVEALIEEAKQARSVVKESLTAQDHIAALVDLSKKDGFAKARIIRDLNAAGFFPPKDKLEKKPIKRRKKK
jgi:hypothetical protein